MYSDLHMVDIYQQSMLLSSRKAYEPIVYFYIEPFVREEEEWLLYDLIDPLGTSWMTLFFDDNPWTETEPGWMSVEEQTSFYLRKHFFTTLTKWSAFAMQIETNAGAEVYVNGRLVYRINLSEGCKQHCIVVNNVHLIQPRVYSFTADVAIEEEFHEGIIAVHLVSYYPVQSVFFKAYAFPICSPTQLSNVHMPIFRSSSIIPVLVFVFVPFRMKVTHKVLFPHLPSISTLHLFFLHLFLFL